MISYKKQTSELKDKIKQKDKEIEKIKHEMKVITFECQKSIKAFTALMNGLTVPQAINDYSMLYEVRNTKLKNKRREENYIG